jgi:hypothetical protein
MDRSRRGHVMVTDLVDLHVVLLPEDVVLSCQRVSDDEGRYDARPPSACFNSSTDLAHAERRR